MSAKAVPGAGPLLSTAIADGAGVRNFGLPAEKALRLAAISSASTSHKIRSSPARGVLFIAVVIALLVAGLRAKACWTTDAWVDVPSGVMLTMATDLKHGLFYRPLFGPEGYGGTRYFPLYFVLDALLLKLGFPVLLSAYLLSAAAIVLLIASTYRLLRAIGAEQWLAFCSMGVLFASVSTQYSLVSPHADGLASALNISALAVLARPKLDRLKILLAAILFTLAWSAKITTVFGLAAALVWLLARGLRRQAWLLAAEAGCGYSVVAGGMYYGSQGRVLQIFKACASGGASWKLIASAPLSIQAIALKHDLSLYCLLIVGIIIVFVAAIRFPAQIPKNLPVLFFGATLAITLMIFGSPGTNINHLLDVQIAAVILVASWLTQAGSLRQRQMGMCALAICAFLTLQSIVQPFLHRSSATNHTMAQHRFQAVLAAIGNSNKPILSENPVISLIAGQSPYVMDPWMLRMLGKRSPGFDRSLFEGMQDQSFGAVVLCMADPRTDYGKVWYDTESFGPGFLAALNRNYSLASVVDDQMIYLPIADAQRANQN